MEQNVDCQNYNDRLYFTEECNEYVKSRAQEVCDEDAMEAAYPDICGETGNSTGELGMENASYSLEALKSTDLYLLIGVAMLTLIAYIIYLFVRKRIEKKLPTHKLLVTLPMPEKEEEEKYMQRMRGFFNSIHDVVNGKRMSVELHNLDGRIRILFTLPDNKTLVNVKSQLTSVEGIYFEETEEDLLEKYSRLHTTKLVLSSNFYTVNLSDSNFCRQLFDYVASLKEGEQAGVMFIIRPTNKKGKIERELNKRDQKADQNRDGLSVSLLQKQSLSEKLESKLFLVQIYAIANSTDKTQGISSIFKSLDRQNSFTSKTVKKLEDVKTRYSPFENIFSIFESISFFKRAIRSFFGSYLNAEELALMLHPIKLERGQYEAEEYRVLEAAPSFFKGGENKVLIGKSTLKTGEPVNVYLPTANLERHVYLAGKTGVGKSTLMILLYLSLAKHSKDKALVIFDPHGADLIDISLRMENWDDLIYFNLAESTKTFTFNPLFSFRTNTRQKDSRIEQTMKILEEESLKKGKDLGTSIEKLLGFLVETGIHFADAYYKFLVEEKGLSTTRAEKLVNERQLTFPDLPYILHKNSEYQDVASVIFKNYGEDIGYKWNTQLGNYLVHKGILDGVENRLKFVVKDSLIPLFEGNKFNIVDLIKERKRILIPITEQSFGPQSKRIITKFLLSQIWENAQSITSEEDRQETILFIDEFQEAQLEIIDSLLSQARKYKIRMVFGNQYFGQLWDNIRRSVMGNVSTLFAFNIGNLEEAKHIPPLFKNKVTEEEVASLPPYKAYLKTLDPASQETVFMSFKTIDYKKEVENKHTKEELRKLNESSLSSYGEEIAKLKKRHFKKMNKPFEYFISSL